VTLWAHQVEGARRAVEGIAQCGGYGLWYGMGSGKSTIALEVMRQLGARRVLVIGPLNTLAPNVWERDASRVFGDHGVPVLNLNSGSTKSKAERFALFGDGIVTVNWESFWREGLYEALKAARFDLVVADEVHRAASAKGRASRALGELGKTTGARLGLSGTPLPHDPLQAWAVMRFISPTLFPRTISQMRARYTRPAERHEYRDPDVLITSRGQGQLAYWKLRDLDELHRTMYRAAHRIRTEDVIDLPDFEDVEIEIELEPSARKVYRELQRELITEIRGGVVTAANAMVAILRLQQITGGWLETEAGDKHEVSTAKRSALADWLADVGDEPVVVFCRFRTDLDNAHRAAKAAGLTAVELSGRVRELEAWQGGAAQVLVAQVQAAREGIDLTRARLNVFYSLDFSYAAYSQARARSLRPGQSRAVQFVHLIVADSVDQRVYRALSNREEVLATVVEGLRTA